MYRGTFTIYIFVFSTHTTQNVLVDPPLLQPPFTHCCRHATLSNCRLQVRKKCCRFQKSPRQVSAIVHQLGCAPMGANSQYAKPLALQKQCCTPPQSWEQGTRAFTSKLRNKVYALRTEPPKISARKQYKKPSPNRSISG